MSTVNSGAKTARPNVTTAKGFMEYAKEVEAVQIDLKFVDMLGTWQHCSYPITQFDEDTFINGLGFDGSSIRGWQSIHASDMLAIPDPSTAMVDPFFDLPTVSVIANIVDPITKKEYSRDPRYVARKAEEYIRKSGMADTCFIGPELEFFIFDEVRYQQNEHVGMYEIDSVEGAWNTARFEEPNLGYKPSFKGGYFPVSPTDTYHDLRTEMVQELEKVGIVVEAHHHEVATAGQSEIDMRFTPLLQMGDQLLWYKYILKNVAKRHNKSVTFMPKPVFGDNGSGMHTHISLWKDGKPLFAGDQYAGLSQMALHAAGGILKHAAALTAITNPTSNSFRRLVPGYEAPVNLAYSARNRSAAIRIPMYSDSPKAKRLECRFPDPTANGYLAFSALLMAAVDGIKHQIDPGKALDRNIYEMIGDEAAAIPNTPGNLSEAIEALKNDHEFLLEGGVFTEDLVQGWIDYKVEFEIKPLALRPHPYEFHLYYDA